MGTRILIVAIAKTVAAMPEKPPPPAVDFNCFFRTRICVSVMKTIFIFNIFVSPTTIAALNVKKLESVIRRLYNVIF